MAASGQEMVACEEGEGMGNNTMSFAVIVIGGGDGSIQAAQGQLRLITAQGPGARRAGLIEQQQWVPPDGQGDNSDSIAIMENNAHQRQWDQEYN